MLGNNCKVSFVTNVLALHVTNGGSFEWKWTFCCLHRTGNKQAAKENQYVSTIYLNATKHNNYKTSNHFFLIELGVSLEDTQSQQYSLH